MWLMLQQQTADDFVIATGKTYTVRHFAELAFAAVGISLTWQGKGENEKGLDAKSGRVLVEIDPRYFRPTEVDLLCGNPAKAREQLGWTATTTVEQLVTKMVRYDLEYDDYGGKEL
jgi:GDPmannose 4,6-dehydratase